MLFAVLPIYFFRTEIPPRYEVATSADLGVCSIYFIGVAICFFYRQRASTLLLKKKLEYLIRLYTASIQS
jgi:hypothetical protein